jgi:hypothetical protein
LPSVSPVPSLRYWRDCAAANGDADLSSNMEFWIRNPRLAWLRLPPGPRVTRRRTAASPAA